MKSAAYYSKTIVIVTMLIALSLWLSITIAEPILAQNYFSLSLEYSIKVILLMLASLYVFSLSVGFWNKWEPYAFVTFPVCVSVLIILLSFNPTYTYAVIAALIFFLLFSYDIYKSMQLKNNMIKFLPSTVLSLSTNGMLFLFSVLGGVMLMLSSNSLPNVNIGKNVSALVEEPMQQVVETQLNQQIPGGMVFLDPTQINLGGLIEEQVNSFIEPYKNLLNPILAVWMFALFQFYAAIAKLIYAGTIDSIFWLAKKVGFLNVEKIQVEKEILKF